jgi:hypothetical protein
VDKYYCVTTLTKDPAEPEEKWYADFRKKYPCLHGQEDEPLEVVVAYLGRDVALNFVQGVGATFARLDFLEVLDSAGEEHLAFTRLLDATRSTAWPDHPVSTQSKIRRKIRIRKRSKSKRKIKMLHACQDAVP